jgi:hypothetical protein
MSVSGPAPPRPPSVPPGCETPQNSQEISKEILQQLAKTAISTANKTHPLHPVIPFLLPRYKHKHCTIIYNNIQ